MVEKKTKTKNKKLLIKIILNH